MATSKKVLASSPLKSTAGTNVKTPAKTPPAPAAATTDPKRAAQAILDEIRPLGLASYRKVMLQHGVPEPIYGVKIEEMKKIVKRVKRDYALALALWDTGVYDARYLAGLIADDPRMTRADLQHWVKTANCGALAEYTVPWVAAGNPLGQDLGLEWIDSKDEKIASSGWATLGGIVAITPDADLDMHELKSLLARIEKTIDKAPNRVRYVMNAFVIQIGCYVAPLTATALATAKRIGKVHVDVGDTSCKIPDVAEYIERVRARGTLGKKRKMLKC